MSGQRTCKICGGSFLLENWQIRHIERDGTVRNWQWRYRHGRRGLLETTVQEVACAKRHGLTVEEALFNGVQPSKPDPDGHRPAWALKLERRKSENS